VETPPESSLNIYCDTIQTRMALSVGVKRVVERSRYAAEKSKILYTTINHSIPSDYQAKGVYNEHKSEVIRSHQGRGSHQGRVFILDRF
jgi:hypothetical protein